MTLSHADIHMLESYEYRIAMAIAEKNYRRASAYRRAREYFMKEYHRITHGKITTGG